MGYQRTAFRSNLCCTGAILHKSLVPHPGSRDNLLSERSKYAEFIGKKQKITGGRAIIVDILEVLQVAVPMLPVLVSIVEVDHGPMVQEILGSTLFLQLNHH